MVEVVVHLVGLAVIDDLGEQPAAVGIQAVVEVAVAVVPGDAQVKALELRLADALLVHVHADHARDVGRVDEDVAAIFQEAFRIDHEALAEEAEVDAGGRFLRQFRSQGDGRQRAFGAAAEAGTAVGAEVVAVAAHVVLAPELVLQVAVGTAEADGAVHLQVRLAVQDDGAEAHARIPVEALALGHVGGTRAVHDHIGKDAFFPVIAHRAQDFLGLGRIVLAAEDPGALAVGRVRLHVVRVEVALPVQARLKFHLHLQAVEIVVVIHRLGAHAVVLLLAEDVVPVALGGHGAHELRILPVLGGALVQEADVVEGHVRVGGQARDEHPEVLPEQDVRQHLGLGPLALTVLLHHGHRVDVAVQGGSAVHAVRLHHREGGGGQGVERALDAAGIVTLVEFREAGLHADLHQCGRRDVHVHVRADAQAVVIVVRVVAVVGGSLPVQEVLLQVVDRGEIPEVAVAALEGELGLVVVAMVAEHLVPPVDVRIGVRILAAVQGEELRIVVLGGQAVQRAGLVHQETVGVGVGELGRAEHGLQAVLILGRHLERGILAALGRDGNDAVAALDAV